MSKFEHHITITSENTNAITMLENVCDLSRAQIKSAIDKGALWLSKGKSTQRFRRIKKTLSVGDELHFYYNPAVLSHAVDNVSLIADMDDYSVWYKPYGVLSQGSKWSDHTTVSRQVQKHFNSDRNVFIVHRLDKAATGLIIIAHTKKAAQGFSALFEHHDLDKHYRIVVHGHFTEQNQPLRIETQIDDKKAISHFTLRHYDEDKDQSLIDVKIETGRKHQIRIHAASIGHSIVGDRLHGDELAQDYLKNHEVNLQLCAVFLRFTCPISKKVKEVVLPDNLRPTL